MKTSHEASPDISVESIKIKNARAGNLRNIDIEIPINSITVITGPGGSGKTSLAFQVLYRFNDQAFRRAIGEFVTPVPSHYLSVVDYVSPVMATVGLPQFPEKVRRDYSVGHYIGFDQALCRLLTVSGELVCENCNCFIKTYSPYDVCRNVFKLPENTRFYILSDIGQISRTKLTLLLKELTKKGFVRVFIDGRLYELHNVDNIPRRPTHRVSVVVDRLVVDRKYADRIAESAEIAYRESPLGVAKIVTTSGEQLFFSNRYICSKCGREYPALSFDLLMQYLGSFHSSEKNKEFLIKWESWNLAELYNQSFNEIYELVRDYESDNTVTMDMVSEVVRYCRCVKEFGVGYLSPASLLRNISSGEFQKLRLSRLLTVDFSGLLLVFDMPSKFLDKSCVEFFCSCLRSLCQRGNTIVVVDHNMDVIRSGHLIVEMGPGAGPDGGRVVWNGRPSEYVRPYANESEAVTLTRKDEKLSADNQIVVRGAKVNNLKEVSILVPTPSITLITGPVGSGKTSLANSIVTFIKGEKEKSELAQDIRVPENLTKVLYVSESAVLGSGKSSVATIMNVLSPIRSFFAKLPVSRRRGYSSKHFSYTYHKVQCPLCKGFGILGYSNQKSSDVMICNGCGGRRYNDEIIKVKYKGYSIADLMDFSVLRIVELFSFLPVVKNRLKILIDLGMGYVRFGQPLVTLSGGEIKLLIIARYISILSTSSDANKKVLFVFDNPFSGLSRGDIDKLFVVWYELVNMGHTVIVCDANSEFASFCDWLVVLGPGSGPSGGRLLKQGKPQVANI